MGCIKRSEAVIVVSGTTGMQSLALGKKTIVLGKAVYSYLNTTFKLKNLGDIKTIINLKWTKSHVIKQKKDFIKYINSILNTSNIVDNKASYWNQGREIRDTLDIDIALYKILKNIQIDV